MTYPSGLLFKLLLNRRIILQCHVICFSVDELSREAKENAEALNQAAIQYNLQIINLKQACQSYMDQAAK